LSNQRLAELLAELNRELEGSSELDAETRALLEKLDEDIDRLTGDDDSPLDRAQQLESRFAAEHPVAARIARELADTLAKMGI
jgi:chromosome segregation ATPase